MDQRVEAVEAGDGDVQETNPRSEPCVILIFGASGDLTKRLLVPALYNLECDQLLSPNCAILGSANEALTDEAFRERMTGEIQKFHTRKEFDQGAWDRLAQRLHYTPGGFTDLQNYERLKQRVAELMRSSTLVAIVRRLNTLWCAMVIPCAVDSCWEYTVLRS